MNRRVIGAVAAVLLATVGGLVLFAWVQSAEQRALAGEATVDVLVVREPVEEGEAAADLGAKVETEQVPAKVAAEGSVDDLADLEGTVAAVDLQPGEQVISSRFLQPAQFREQSGVEVPEGLQEIALQLEAQRVVGGQLRPGDTAGVFLSFEPFEDVDGSGEKIGNETHLTFHKVLVTNVQVDRTAQPTPEPDADDDAQADEPGAAPGGPLHVTLAVDAAQAERIVFGAEFGRIWLSKEPATANEDGTGVQNRGTIYE